MKSTPLDGMDALAAIFDAARKYLIAAIAVIFVTPVFPQSTQSITVSGHTCYRPTPAGSASPSDVWSCQDQNQWYLGADGNVRQWQSYLPYNFSSAGYSAFPLFIYLPGTAWTMATNVTLGQEIAKGIAAQGFVVAVPTYRGVSYNAPSSQFDLINPVASVVNPGANFFAAGYEDLASFVTIARTYQQAILDYKYDMREFP